MLKCKICGHSDSNRVHTVREMMFGTGDAFEYIECSSCGCLQIADIPSDMSGYYPSDYYSFDDPYQFKSPKEKFIASHIAQHSFHGRNPIGWWYGRRYPAELHPQLHRTPTWLKGNKLQLNRKSRVLDIGCGAGVLLYEMKDLLGFSSLTGIDPFIESDRHYENGVKVVKAMLSDVHEQFDLIMLHHSFEHMPDPLTVLKHLRRLLRPKGWALVRIPICSSFAWRNYGVNWAQLDAPRHFFIHSVASLRILAEQASFNIKEIIYDSNEFQFWGSEQYKMGIPLMGDNSYGVNPKNSIFTKDQIDSFAKMAEELNESGDGDQACFLLGVA